MSFTRRKENFICAHCDAAIVGNGYTNHCPRCLWSRHVDIDPGDRAETCGGMMEPIGVRVKRDEVSIQHCCVKCKKEMLCRTSTEDDAEMIAKISAQ